MRSVAFTILLAAACGCAVTTEPELGEEFQLRVGQHVSLPGIGVWVAVIGVSADSRCPSQAMCVWAGDAAVLVEAAPYPDALSPDAEAHTLHTNLGPKSLALGAFTLDLVQLDPYPETPSSISADEYIATFVIR